MSSIEILEEELERLKKEREELEKQEILKKKIQEEREKLGRLNPSFWDRFKGGIR